MVFANGDRDSLRPAAVRGSIVEADRLRAGRAICQIPTVLYVMSVEPSQGRFSDYPQHDPSLMPDNVRIKVY
jgi:hypothetical protein